MEVANKRIALAGILASFTHKQAFIEIERHGGIGCAEVNMETDFLVVGQGEPHSRFRIARRKIAVAESLRRLGKQIGIRTEGEFLESIGQPSGICTAQITMAHLAKATGLSAKQLHWLIRIGGIQVRETIEKVYYFDFLQLNRAHQISKWVSNGVSWRRIKTLILRLRRQEVNFEDNSVVFCSSNGDGIYLRDNKGRLRSLSGQLFLDFETMTLPIHDDEAGLFDHLFATAWQAETNGDYDKAVKSYYQLLMEKGANATICFNLGNCLYALKKFDAACERYRQALELDSTKLFAWNNLGNALLNDPENVDEAICAFRNATGPDGIENPDAIFNIARAYEQKGDIESARHFWTQYLRIVSDADGCFAEIAHKKLNQTEGKQVPALLV
ncbi:MAG: tetratricopeptide repeat protein [Pirellula sp.]|nr:tetratricopeptide repeat protein [Pirellula sp.]